MEVEVHQVGALQLVVDLCQEPHGVVEGDLLVLVSRQTICVST